MPCLGMLTGCISLSTNVCWCSILDSTHALSSCLVKGHEATIGMRCLMLALKCVLFAACCAGPDPVRCCQGLVAALLRQGQGPEAISSHGKFHEHLGTVGRKRLHVWWGVPADEGLLTAAVVADGRPAERMNVLSFHGLPMCA